MSADNRIFCPTENLYLLDMNAHRMIAGLFGLIILGLAACTTQAETNQAIETTPVETPVQVVSDSQLPPQVSTPVFKYPATVDELVGKFEPGSHPDFVKIEQKYTTKSGIYMRKDAYESFIAMHAAAKVDGIDLIILSATRNFASQKGIWENKWTGQTAVDGRSLPQSHPEPKSRALKILNFSSMPGTSRHHWGTDIDLNNLTNTYFDSGKGKAIYDWLVANAATYGFCQPYSPKGDKRPDGYNEERWHWSYMPISAEFLQQYGTDVKYDQISGFKGSETATQIDVITKYVKGIAPLCLQWKVAESK